MLPVILAVGGIASLAVYAKQRLTGSSSFGSETDELHDRIYNHVLDNVKDPEKIRAMGHAFISGGKEKQGDILLKRAENVELPLAIKKQRREAFKKAVQSQDADKLHAVANVFEQEGCVGAANNLRQIASSLKTLK